MLNQIISKIISVFMSLLILLFPSLDIPQKDGDISKSEFSCMRDDLTIRGHVYKTKEGTLPAVILSHGFMSNENNECADYAKLFARMGYAAFTFDFCGGGVICHSDGKSEEMSVLTEKKDLESVLEYVKSLPDVDSDNISLLGCSQGGLVSTLVAGEHPEIKNLILLYPAYSIPDDARSGNMLMMKFDPENIPDIISRFPMKLGKCYAEAVMNMDYKDIVASWKGNTILIHGTADNVVDISYSRQASKIFENCHYYEIEGGGHVFTSKYNKEVLEILENELRIQ